MKFKNKLQNLYLITLRPLVKLLKKIYPSYADTKFFKKYSNYFVILPRII
jgi:hypothetical protein